MSSQPPRRRRRRRPQSESESDSPLPRRRKKKSGTSGKKKRKKSANHAALLKIALIASIGIVLLGGLFMVDWQDVGVAVGMDRSLEKLLTDLKYYQKKQLDLVASLQSKEQADAAASQLDEVAKELAKVSFEYDTWRSPGWRLPEDEEKIRASQNRAPEIIEAERKLSGEISRLMSEHPAKLTREVERKKQESKAGSHIGYLVYKARKAAVEYGKELRMNKAKEGAFKNGYSPVTADTRLTEGMQIQGIDAFYHWEECIVRAVNQDGTVWVNFQNGGPSLFDKKLERDRLRIPDGNAQVNTVSPVNPERVGGNFRRVEPSRPKRVPTGREF